MKSCKRCKKYEVEYDVPGKWCRFCWGKWFYYPDFWDFACPREKHEYKLFVKRTCRRYGPAIKA
ncbi:hypothetical protein C4577_05130 [Candidatus Parcubacteria bacterium]|nr:MAG: hypothetical protein C4577_05130 [Candidatus Parcubacteria bacterium]